MRLITWNCAPGRLPAKEHRIGTLEPDVAVLQEAPQRGNAAAADRLWVGTDERRGILVLTRNGYRVEPGPAVPGAPRSVVPVRVTGPTEFHLLAVWAIPEPTYTAAVHRGIEAYESWLADAPAVVAGDLNSNTLPTHAEDPTIRTSSGGWRRAAW